MKKVLVITLLAVLSFGVFGVANAESNMDFDVQGYSAFLGPDYLGAQVIADVGDFENAVFGIARAQTTVTNYNGWTYEEDTENSIEAFVGRRFEDLPLGRNYSMSYELALGLNTDEGMTIVATTNYPINENYNLGLTASINGGAALNLNYMY